MVTTKFKVGDVIKHKSKSKKYQSAIGTVREIDNSFGMVQYLVHWFDLSVSLYYMPDYIDTHYKKDKGLAQVLYG